MSLYNIKSDTAAQSYNVEQFIVTKFDHELNVEASYLLSSSGCSCPAGVRPSCRHRQMLPNLRQRANTAWFWDFTREAWVDPTGEASKPAAVDEAKLDEDQVPGTGPSEIGADQASLAPQADSQAGFRRRV